ncbi:Alpha/beta hydrolase family [Moraxella caviae]|nr:alpha/beta hydrolase [Moraxella caviae]STZ14291.1 Alpha/beta hydrolase family [Moraxella caviae]VEW10762.1 Alpha/beta hydrolase family [Moraxella caviae]
MKNTVKNPLRPTFKRPTFKRPTFKRTNLALCAAMLSVLGVSGCASLTPPKQVQARVIETTRSNITTAAQVSNLTQSILLSAGLTQDDCVADWTACMDGLKSAFFSGEFDQEVLALLAEMSYTRALHLASQDRCQFAPDRAPIDPYYANAPLAPEVLARLQAEHHACRREYLSALYDTIRYSYAYLFFDSLTARTNQGNALVKDNDIKAQDLYHLAINALIGEVYKQQDGAFANAKDERRYTHDKTHDQIIVSSLHTGKDDTAYTLNLAIANDPYYLQNLNRGDEHVLSDLISIYDNRLANLQVTSTRAGLGVGFVGSLQGRQTKSVKHALENALQTKTSESTSQTPAQPLHTKDDPATRIHNMGHLLLTGVIVPQGDTLDDVLSTRTFNTYFFNPYKTQNISILGKDYPLMANFSATYATWLSENNLQQISLLNMLSTSDEAALPELFMLSPYNPEQQVIIMLHGLASSPTTWVNLTNNLLADPVLRNNYQVWQVAYSTNLPILENRYQIWRLIDAAFKQTDPTGKARASQQGVLIGHSMGGVIARMLVSDDDLLIKLNELDAAQNSETGNTATHSKFTATLLSQQYGQEFDERFTLHALPQINEAVFISAPFRGTDYADRWFTRAARRIISLPLNLTKAAGDILTNADNGDASLLGSLYLENGASQLSDRSSFVALTKDVQISDGVRYHTIVGNHTGQEIDGKAHSAGDMVGAGLSDGIVPFSSSHLAGAASETIITGGHNAHENPKTILQLRRILHNHLKDGGTDNRTTDKKPSQTTKTDDSPIQNQSSTSPIPSSNFDNAQDGFDEIQDGLENNLSSDLEQDFNSDLSNHSDGFSDETAHDKQSKDKTKTNLQDDLLDDIKTAAQNNAPISLPSE